MPRRAMDGSSTPMPIVQLELGRYVTVRRRADGTARVLFEVPPRLRPSDWPATIPLPLDGPRRGDLDDAAEVARIQADARQLHLKLLAWRQGRKPEPKRSLKGLVRIWHASGDWKTLAATSQKHYEAYIRNILPWAEAAGEPDPTTLTKSDVEAFLSIFDDRPPTKKHTLKALGIIMGYAVSERWRTDNPCDKIKVKLAVSKARIWEQADVDAYIVAAESIGRRSIANMVRLEWAIGQRVTDLRKFRLGAEYDAAAGMFRFYQSKTDSYMTLPVGPDLKALLAEISEGHLFMFRDESTGKAYTAERCVKVFAQVREIAVANGAQHLKLKWLRHSCVVQLARHGAEVPEIASVTGHAPASVLRILSTYLPRDSEVAFNAMAKRGLVNR